MSALSPGSAVASDSVGADVAVVLLAAGTGSRTGLDTNKVLLPLAGRHVLTWSLDWTKRLPDVVRTIAVVRSGEQSAVRRVVRRESPDRAVEVVIGGASRHESEYNALCALAPDISSGAIGVVVIHDAARPLAGLGLYEGVIDAARAYGGAIPVNRREDLVFAADGSLVGPSVTVQTPQAFRAQPLLAAYRSAQDAGFEGTDTAASVERFTDLTVRGVPGDARNIKITYPEDLFMAERLLARSRRDL